MAWEKATVEIKDSNATDIVSNFFKGVPVDIKRISNFILIWFAR